MATALLTAQPAMVNASRFRAARELVEQAHITTTQKL